MITSILAILFLFSMAAGISGHTGRKMEACLPLAVCVTAAWLYLFYCLSILWAGLVLYCLSGVLLLFLALRKNRNKDFLRHLFSPGASLWLCMCALFVICFSGNQVGLIDELRLWAAVPKAMHCFGTLQLGDASPIFPTMQSYPPGLSLLTFFFSAFERTFEEGPLFAGYACTTMTFFLPAFSGWKWKDWRLLAPCGLAVYAVPFVFTSHFGDSALFGMSLFVDCILGVTAGYAFFLAARDPFRDRFESIRFTLTLMFLSLLKSTGIAFGLCALVCALIPVRRKFRGQFLMPVLGILAGIGTWKLLLLCYDVRDLVPLDLHLLSWEALSNLLRGMVSINVVAYKVPLGPLLSFVSVYGILWIFFAVSARCWHRQCGRTETLAGICMLASAVAFLYGYGAIYARSLASFPRYMETLLLCLATYLVLRDIPLCRRKKPIAWAQKLRPGLLKGAVCMCLLTALGVTLLWQYVFPEYKKRDQADEEAQRIRQAVLADHPQGEARVYLVMAGDVGKNAHHHHRMFFTMLSAEVNLRNGQFQTRVIGPEKEDPAADWGRELREGFGYVCVYSVEEELIPVFMEFSDTEPVPGTLYRVEPAQSAYGVRLIPVSSGIFPEL